MNNSAIILIFTDERSFKCKEDNVVNREEWVVGFIKNLPKYFIFSPTIIVVLSRVDNKIIYLIN